MPGCIVSAMTASFISVEKRRRRATQVITSTFENVSDIGVCLGLSLGPPAKAGVRSKQGAVQEIRWPLWDRHHHYVGRDYHLTYTNTQPATNRVSQATTTRLRPTASAASVTRSTLDHAFQS